MTTPILYVKTGCPWCDEVLEYMDAHKIPYQKVTVTGDREAALYKRLLEANASELVGVAFGLRDGEVVLVSERSVRDLDGSEVDALIRSVGRVADRFDDALAKEFGAQRSSDPTKG